MRYEYLASISLYLLMAASFSFSQSSVAAGEIEDANASIPNEWFTHAFIGTLERSDDPKKSPNLPFGRNIEDHFYYIHPYYFKVQQVLKGAKDMFPDKIPFPMLEFLMDDRSVWITPDSPLFYRLGHRYLILLRMAEGAELHLMRVHGWEHIRIFDLEESMEDAMFRAKALCDNRSADDEALFRKDGVFLLFPDAAATKEEVVRIKGALDEGALTLEAVIKRYGRPLAGWINEKDNNFIVLYPSLEENVKNGFYDRRTTKSGAEITILNKNIVFFVFSARNELIVKFSTINSFEGRIRESPMMLPSR